jgi:hypothetical protein
MQATTDHTKQQALALRIKESYLSDDESGLVGQRARLLPPCMRAWITCR